MFGSSTIVISIEAIKGNNGEYFAYTDNGREYTGVDVMGWAKKVEDLGAGEIVITSVDNEEPGGFDLELVNRLNKIVDIPIVAHGGAGKKLHFLRFENKFVDAAMASSILHYNFLRKMSLYLLL